jgi:hypothetical protein
LKSARWEGGYIYSFGTNVEERLPAVRSDAEMNAKVAEKKQ